MFLTAPIQKASNLKAGKLCKKEPLCGGNICRQRPVATKQVLMAKLENGQVFCE